MNCPIVVWNYGVDLAPLTKPRACNTCEAPLSPGTLAHWHIGKIFTLGNQSGHSSLLITTFLSYFPRLLSHHCWILMSSTSKWHLLILPGYIYCVAIQVLSILTLLYCHKKALVLNFICIFLMTMVVRHPFNIYWFSWILLWLDPCII